jgi:transposase
VGLPVSLKLVCGNEHDSKSAVDTLRGHIDGSFVLADRGYDCDALRRFIREENGFPVIPPKSNRTKPIDYNKQIGKLRHRVENFFANMKRYRRLSTRYDKLPETYLGFVTLASLKDWINFDFVHVA